MLTDPGLILRKQFQKTDFSHPVSPWLTDLIELSRSGLTRSPRDCARQAVGLVAEHLEALRVSLWQLSLDGRQGELIAQAGREPFLPLGTLVNARNASNLDLMPIVPGPALAGLWSTPDLLAKTHQEADRDRNPLARNLLTAQLNPPHPKEWEPTNPSREDTGPDSPPSILRVGLVHWPATVGWLEIVTLEALVGLPEQAYFLQTITQILAGVIDRDRATGHQTHQISVIEEILAQMADGTNLTQTLNHLCLLMERQLPEAYCSILLVDSDQKCLRSGAAPSLPPNYAAGLDGLLIGPCAGSCGTAAYRGETVFVKDISTHPLWVPFRDFARSHGIQSCWSQPFKDRDGQVLGTFAITHRYPCAPTNGDRVALNLATHLASIATMSHRDRTRLESARDQATQEAAAKTRALQERETALFDLQQAQTRLLEAQKLSSLGQLLAGVGHEINNPLHCIAGNIKPAQSYLAALGTAIDLYDLACPELPADIADHLAEIDVDFTRQDFGKLLQSIALSAHRLTDIAQSLRNLVRVDTDEPVACALQDGLESTLLVLQHRLKATIDRPEIHVIRQWSALPLIPGFPGQLSQVFMNLLANAIDAIEEARQGWTRADWQKNPGKIEVTTQIQPNENTITIMIRDNGIGMAADVQQHLFDYLYTTKPIGKGTGIGLAISRQIIHEKHGGRITVESVYGQGSMFTVTLPIDRARP